MPYLMSNGRGGYRLKRSIGTVAGVEIGKIDLPMGTKDLSIANEIEDVVTNLTELGAHGAVLLLDIAKKRRKPIDVYHLWQNQEVKNVSTLVGEESLAEAWKGFLATAKRKNGTSISDRTKRDYDGYLKRLLEVNPESTVRELPDVLRAYRDVCTDENLPRHATFRKVKASCLAFARNTQADRQFSPLWRAIAQIDGTPNETIKQDTALPVWEVRESINKLPTPQLKNIAWALALVGFRISEYAGAWEIHDHSVVIHGTKSGAAKRTVPLIARIHPEPFIYWQVGRNSVRPDAKPVRYETLCEELKKAGGSSLTPHTLRHSFRLWMREAQIDEWRADRYFGHKVVQLRRKYAAHEVALRLEEDTEKLKTYFKSQQQRPKKRKAKKVRLLEL